ncbi:flagellar motor switch protein FliN [Brachyspira hyodysenteriae]|uniref:Flagellar motor switch protein FliN n=1 Tax=Brachyspira hyodysenteriae (strain ATCC 49526 / WA1) TaxID=565034 RepID=A0A3B6VBF0_BRAHW|nr:flagellar motor switch protein FliN [Brachyspira hyodysenteriae]ACN83867.1 flagellar motor switch protein [Brachyspira hyodysenteriae WA1]KLI14465.1 flagellar motor switch protein FliN [Brachyspira hyodysenteriae]KLI17771.1 flagellar motor switch protein FliN [Brachyspira hyodysenteriae]KLI19374.1 flagellar motor switch protein FliN [Brachyspira hyodysenteriae]KLI27410.1 flagellar motor switch protein FliN [Brachyspira hyodysenteriae]
MMSDGALSQDEIEALLKGADEAFGGDTAPKASSNGGGNVDKQLFNEAAKMIAENQAFSLSSISTKTVSITNITTTVGDVNNLHQMLSGKMVEAKVGYTGSINGNVYYFMGENEALVVASLMMGQKEAALNDMVSQVLKEAFSQMVGVSDSALSSRFGGSFTNSPIETSILEDAFSINIPGPLAIVSGSLSIEGEVDNAPYVFALELPLLQSLIGSASNNAAAPAAGGNASNAGASANNSMAGLVDNQAFDSGPQLGVQHAEFNSLMPASDVQGTGNIGLLMDVTMNMTVELGRATMTIRDILGLGEGSIIELQKLAGEPVDLLVNGKLIAKGEVVVIDENFGVRVTDIINPMDRLTNKPR